MVATLEQMAKLLIIRDTVGLKRQRIAVLVAHYYSSEKTKDFHVVSVSCGRYLLSLKTHLIINLKQNSLNTVTIK